MVRARTDLVTIYQWGQTLHLAHPDMDPLSDPSAWYSILCAGLIVLIISCFITSLASQWLASRLTDAILKYLVYSTMSIFKLHQWRFSVKDLIFPVLHLSGNGFCMGWGVKAAEELSSRCASLLATNLVLLLPGASIAADVLHISLLAYHQMHSIIGLVAVIQGSIHAGQKLAAVGWTRDMGSISGIAVSESAYKSTACLTLSDCWMPRTDERCIFTHLP
jgi:hypothetical protein